MTIDRKKPGDKRIAATDWNKLADVANRLPNTGGQLPFGDGNPIVVTVKNDSDAEMLPFNVAGIGTSFYTTANQIRNEIIMVADTYDAATHGTSFGIIQRHAVDTQGTELVTAGICIANVDVSDASHKYAAPATGEAMLQSATAGPVKILYKPSGTGEKECVVMLRDIQDGQPFENDSGEAIPPHAVMEVTEINASGVAQVVKPTGRREVTYLINREAEVPTSGKGVGDWGFDRPVKVLCCGQSPPYSDDDTYQIINRSFAPRAGYWHLRSESNAGGSQGATDYYREQAGFKRVVKGGWSIESYEYDFGGDVGTQYAIGYYFCQQLDHPENSAIWHIDKVLSKTYADEWTTIAELEGGFAYIKLHQGGDALTEVSDPLDNNYNKLGVKAFSEPGENNEIFQFYRTGLYQVDWQLQLEFDGNPFSEAFTTENATVESGQPPVTYQKLKRFAMMPAIMRFEARVDNFNLCLSRGGDAALEGVNNIYQINETVPFISDGAAGSWEVQVNRRGTFFVRNKMAEAGSGQSYDPSNNYGWLSLALTHAKRGTSSFIINTKMRVRAGFIKITRLRDQWFMLD